MKSKKQKKEIKTHSDIYVSNKECGITDWLPPAKKEFYYTNSNSWFDIKYYERKDLLHVTKYKVKCPVIPPDSLKQQMISIGRKKKI